MAIVHSRIADRGLSPWGKAFAGAMAACLANTLVYPLDLAKTRLQVQNSGNGTKCTKYIGVMDVLRKVYVSGGVKALYGGILGNLAGTVSTNFAYFYWYSLLRGAYIRRYAHGQAHTLSTAAELLLGALAGTIAQIFTIPVAVITIRQQTHGMSFIEAFRDVLGHDGVRGLWRGLKASLILVLNPSITYGSSSKLRSVLFGNRQNLTAAQNFMLGALSKCLATFATQPLIVSKVVQQSSSKYGSFVQVLAQLIKNGGITELFRGIMPQLSKAVLVQGLLLAFKDKVEGYILRLLILLSRKSVVSV